jgi:hypothetical protein
MMDLMVIHHLSSLRMFFGKVQSNKQVRILKHNDYENFFVKA